MLSRGSEPIRALASISMVSAVLLGDENDLLGMNLLHLSGSKLDNKFLGSTFHWGAFHLESDGLSRWHCPRKFKRTQMVSKVATEEKCMKNQASGSRAALGKSPLRSPVKWPPPGVQPFVSVARQTAGWNGCSPIRTITNPPGSQSSGTQFLVGLQGDV